MAYRGKVLLEPTLPTAVLETFMKLHVLLISVLTVSLSATVAMAQQPIGAPVGPASFDTTSAITARVLTVADLGRHRRYCRCPQVIESPYTTQVPAEPRPVDPLRPKPYDL